MLAESLQRAYKSTVRDVFLLERAERTAASYVASSRDRLRELFAAGARRVEAAADLAESQPASAAVLYLDAALLFIGAIFAGRGDVSDLDRRDPGKAFESLEAIRSELGPFPDSYDDARKVLVSADPLELDRLSDREAFARLQTVQSTVGWLREITEPRTVRQIKVARYVRVGFFGTAAVCLLAWSGVKLFAPKNIALHKPVTQSSVHPNSTAQPGGLTDGETGGSYGIHTNREEDPWVRVDLQEPYALKKVKIYNRGDGWFDAHLPLTLEFSDDGVNFRPVDKRTTTFGQWSPWVFNAGGAKTRFIQIRAAKDNFIALSEIEAFGSK
ncbi:MAG TPA: discoidin domain-containing protein [Polyangiaceae bacterium]|nr:discoidin domain-containing protein [Polyangiaceae bacterium]